MRKARRTICTVSGALGLAGAAAGGGEQALRHIMRPFSALGLRLRALSLSGAAGNAWAWVIAAAISLLPVVYILIARRRRRQPGDILFVLAGACMLGGIFLLANPTLLLHPMLQGAQLPAETLALAPAAAMLSMLLAAAVVRWAGGLTESGLTDWLGALLTALAALIAYASARDAAGAVLGAIGRPTEGNELQQYLGSLSQASGSGWAALLPALIALIPNGFLLAAADGAGELVSAVGRERFGSETEACAARLAALSRNALTALVVCAAVRNITCVLLAPYIQNVHYAVDLPLDAAAMCCAAMLLARLIRAACRVKRDNELMI